MLRLASLANGSPSITFGWIDSKAHMGPLKGLILTLSLKFRMSTLQWRWCPYRACVSGIHGTFDHVEWETLQHSGWAQRCFRALDCLDYLWSSNLQSPTFHNSSETFKLSKPQSKTLKYKDRRSHFVVGGVVCEKEGTLYTDYPSQNVYQSNSRHITHMILINRV